MLVSGVANHFVPRALEVQAFRGVRVISSAPILRRSFSPAPGLQQH
jgi:hypothetical protein